MRQTCQEKYAISDTAQTSEASVFRRSLSDKGAPWEKEIFRLAELVQDRNYATQTVNAYTGGVRTFQAFTRSKTPELIVPEDIRTFLDSLLKKRRMTLRSIIRLSMRCF